MWLSGGSDENALTEPWILHLLDHGDVHVRKSWKSIGKEKNQLGLHCPSWTHTHTCCFSMKSPEGLKQICIKPENLPNLPEYHSGKGGSGSHPHEGL